MCEWERGSSGNGRVSEGSEAGGGKAGRGTGRRFKIEDEDEILCGRNKTVFTHAHTEREAWLCLPVLCK